MILPYAPTITRRTLVGEALAQLIPTVRTVAIDLNHAGVKLSNEAAVMARESVPGSGNLREFVEERVVVVLDEDYCRNGNVRFLKTFRDGDRLELTGASGMLPSRNRFG